MDFNQGGFKIKDGTVKLSHSYNNIPLEFNIPEKFGFDSDNNKRKVKQVSIFRSKDGEFYLSITRLSN